MPMEAKMNAEMKSPAELREELRRIAGFAPHIEVRGSDDAVVFTMGVPVAPGTTKLEEHSFKFFDELRIEKV